MKCRTHICHAACCYNIPLECFELERFADRIVTPVLFTMPMERAVVPFTDEDPKRNRCPFLRHDYRCNIYENRPDICRKFGEVKELFCKYRR